jgi:Sec-independent protein translocase protein TatA
LFKKLRGFKDELEEVKKEEKKDKNQDSKEDN